MTQMFVRGIGHSAPPLNARVHAHLHGRLIELQRLPADAIVFTHDVVVDKIAWLERAKQHTHAQETATLAELNGRLSVWYELRKDPQTYAKLLKEVGAWLSRREKFAARMLTHDDYADMLAINSRLVSHVELDHDAQARIVADAQGGDRNAQFILARHYSHGPAGERNDTIAFYWYRKAAEQGHPAAQTNVALFLWYGRGTPQDRTAALKWYRKAADLGDATAQTNLGNAYAQGWGVEKDAAKAVFWFRKAADQGRPVSQYSLACAYWNGTGIEGDPDKALALYRKAANQGHIDSQKMLAWVYRLGYGVQQDVVMAATWYAHAANRGDAHSQMMLGLAYWNGFGVGKNREKAVTLFRQAALQGDASAKLRLAHAYRYGVGGVERNQEIAFSLYYEAAEQGEVLAQTIVADCYMKGIAVAQDHGLAALWLLKAANQNHSRAQYHLAKVYWYGQGVEQNYVIAVSWLRKSAEQGEVAAQHLLAYAYATGTGTVHDNDLARFWYRRAADTGYVPAQAALHAMNDAHHSRLDATFGAQLSQLAQRYQALTGINDAQAVNKIHEQLIHDFTAAAESPTFPDTLDITLAKKAVDQLCGKGPPIYAMRDWAEHQGRQSLAYVHAYICEQPSQEARDRGIRSLIEHLAIAQGRDYGQAPFCMTRHVEEMLTSLQTAFPEQISELFTGEALGVPVESRRDLLLNTAKTTLRNIGADAPHAAVLRAFNAAAAENHPEIMPKDVADYVRDFLTPEYLDILRDAIA